MWKRVQGFLVLVFLSLLRNLFVENYNINRLCPSGATLRFSTLIKLSGCAAGEGSALIYWRNYKQFTPLPYLRFTNFQY